ncbi:MAG: MarR family transcriptional regulator [Marinifilaceae bacterium]|jgi:DNA-binding MarR family transcriptional regulator|nr:MarR family transcriptional regulator [Marinifilaceae bacterium]
MNSKFFVYIEKMTAIHNKIIENEKKPRNFGTEYILYQSEIHCIEAIGNHEPINASELSKILGITNGAVTQITDKLINKNLVIKYINENNKKERFFKLTGTGKTAYIMHEKYHEKMYKKIIEYFEGLNGDELKAFTGLIEFIERNI